MARLQMPDGFGGIGAVPPAARRTTPIGAVPPAARPKRTAAAPKRKIPKTAIGAVPAVTKRPVGAVSNPKRSAPKAIGAVPPAARNAKKNTSKTTKKNTRTTTNTRTVNKEPRISTQAPDTTTRVKGISTDPASVEVPEPPKPLSMEDWLLQDSAYTSEQAALAAARDAALAEYSRNRDLNAQDFSSSLGNLGRRWEDTNNNGIADEDEIAASTWDRDNTQGAYGQSYKNTLEDFTGRGLLDSSFFADALTELDTSFDSQLGDMTKARQNALAELLGRENEAKSAYETGLGQAQATAAERRAAKYGL